MEMEVKQEVYENTSVKYLNQPQQDQKTDTSKDEKPKVPPKPKKLAEDVTSGKYDENYEIVETDIDVNTNENQASNSIKPEIPAKGQLKSNDIPLEPCGTNALKAPTAQYVDYRQQFEYLIPKDDPKNAATGIPNPRSKTSNVMQKIPTAICKHKGWCICVAVMVVLIIGLVIAVVIVAVKAVRKEDAKLQNYVLPKKPSELDQLYKVYVTPQKNKTTSVVISLEMAEKWDSMYDQTSNRKTNITYVARNGKTASFNSFLYKGRAYASKISSDNKVTNIYQKAGSDSFLVLPEKLLDTRYTIASVGHRINNHNICNQSSFIYAKEHERVTYTNGISLKDIQMKKLGNEEKGNVTITATKLVSVLNMYKCDGPLFSKVCDKSYEQVIPDKYLGEEYFVPSFDMTKKDITYSSYIIITSPVDGNEIRYLHGYEGSEETFNLKEGEACKRTYTPAFISCTKTCSVSVMLQFQNKVNQTSIAMTNIIATKNFLTDTSYFSADMSEKSWPNLHLFIVIAKSKSQTTSSKVSLDGQQMQSKWKTPSRLGFTFGVTTALQRKTHYVKSEGLPYMGYLVGTNYSSCGFAHFIDLS